MKRYRAEVWLGSNSGFQAVEVNSSSINGVTEQIKSIYHVKAENIRNIREVNNESISDSGSNPIAGFGVLFLFVLFALYPTMTLTFLFGASGAWITTKLSKKSFSDICDKENKKIYNVVLIITLLCGGFGFYVGDNIEKQQTSQQK